MLRNCGLKIIEDAEVVLLIRELVQRGVRTKYICDILGLSKYSVRMFISKNFPGANHYGNEPGCQSWMVKKGKQERMAHAYILMTFFNQIKPALNNRIARARAIIEAHDNYLLYVQQLEDEDPDNIIDSNRFYRLIYMVENGTYVYRQCSEGPHLYIESNHARSDTCYTCRSLKRYLCVECGNPLPYRGFGDAICETCEKKEKKLSKHKRIAAAR